MKRAFTLIEMMIVVALIAVLMTIVLRLTSVASEETARNTTIMRLARLENCLSGYYAAYGSYPPVQLHNSRDINQEVDALGVQGSGQKSSLDLWDWDAKKFRAETKSGGSSTQKNEQKAWIQVQAACQAQPVSLEAPDPDTDGLDEAFKQLVSLVQQRMSSGDWPNYPKSPEDGDYYIWKNGFGTIYNAYASIPDKVPWRQTQVFKFGLLSFLLPRYQAMMGWRQIMFNGDGDSLFDQWNSNNGNAPHDPYTGKELTWKEINQKVLDANSDPNGNTGRKARAFLEALPPESATSRWLPNLEKICVSDLEVSTYFGVSVNGDGSGMFSLSSSKSSRPPVVKVYSPEGGQNPRNLYHLNQITVRDGWLTEFFYYSAAPYQSYQLWSAGKNTRTFPCWISRQSLESKAKECVAVWTEDDIRGMSN